MRRGIVPVILLTIMLSTSATAKGDYIPEGFEIMRCTCYIPTGHKTATGIEPYEGICACSKDRLGEVAVVYDMDMRIVGIFEVKDTGSHEGLVNGTRIDIFRNDMDGVSAWQKEVGDYVIVQWVKGEG